MKNKKQLIIIYAIASIVGIFQLPLIDNNLNAQSIYLGINEKLPIVKNAHQEIENIKIATVAKLDSVVFNEHNNTPTISSENKVSGDIHTASSETNQSVNNKENSINFIEPIENLVALDNNSEKKLIQEIKIIGNKMVEDVKEEVDSLIIEPSSSSNNDTYKYQKDLIDNDNTLSHEESIIDPTIEIASIIPSENSVQLIEEFNSKEYCQIDCKVLLIGDSVMGDVYYSLSRYLKNEKINWKLINAHKVSSGLTNTGYYDWIATTKQLVSQHKPDYVFVLMGTNDAQNMSLNGKPVSFGKELWIEEYTNRMEQMKEYLDSNVQDWLWIGLPVVKGNSFNNRLQVIRNIQSQISDKNYISNQEIFGKDTEPKSINLNLRAKDGIHLNAKGADVMARFSFEQLIEKIN